MCHIVCLFVCLFVCLLACLLARSLACLCVSLFLCFFVSLFACLFVGWVFCLFYEPRQFARTSRTLDSGRVDIINSYNPLHSGSQTVYNQAMPYLFKKYFETTPQSLETDSQLQVAFYKYAKDLLNL